jgi:hypothetical protein
MLLLKNETDYLSLYLTLQKYVEKLNLKQEDVDLNSKDGDCKPLREDSEGPRKLNKVFSPDTSDFQTTEKI